MAEGYLTNNKKTPLDVMEVILFNHLMPER
jgi:hypothetical protein